ncbi:LamG-like jellyroll fold domain-containing protein [Dawidia soli]|uniref:Disease resistance R13L4/SHOC-2-like LRR domain-containing protein n=1 Tax=Dawidia soli TaxID=2782352 RepID=A0AAP2DA81_9BACT|nr:LamG-like jellyroll fold domain-containing protein [Dawidia soli]MBT1686910.1 hypothetical protein [Dawidia soli]
MRTIFRFFFLAGLFFSTSSGAQTNVVPDAVELAALKQFYTSLGGDSWTKRSNWPTLATWPATATAATMGTWQGVIVQNGDITSLSFNAANLVGELPAELGDLKQLKTLRLDANKLSGSIPVSLGDLSALTVLNLAGNLLTGELPSTLGNLTNLTQLAVWKNRLSGEIPASLSALTQLTILYIHQNQFYGKLPPLVGCRNLKYFHAYSNYFQEGIPDSYSEFSELIEFLVYNNDLSGEFPSLENWPKLTQLLIYDNNFSGAFPSTVDQCPELVKLQARNNAFTSIPNSILSCTKLTTLDFRDNALTSMPVFTPSNFNTAQLTLSISNNYLGFDKLEPLFIAGTTTSIFKSLLYSPQKVNDLVSRVDVPANGALELAASPKGVNGTVAWEKKGAAGTWVAATGDTDNSNQTYSVPNVTVPVAGFYRWTITHPTLPLTLKSGEIEVRITDAVKASTQAIPVYNGLISAVRWRTSKAYGAEGVDLTGMYIYEYDDKYQVLDASWADVNNTLNTYSMSGNKYRISGMAYDANGNIQSLHRYNEAAQEQHKFAYTYDPNKKNRLMSVSGYTNAFTYDAVGRMTGADKETGEDQYIDYDITGKVVAVYTSDQKRPEDKKVEYRYDDRGFRLAKINYPDNRTTWYIRDASGNVLSTYEQEGIPGSGNMSALVKTEIPVYGAGKLGTYYPKQDGSMCYEMTDHLGNVRALVRENVVTYTATMEDSGEESIHNPRVEELQYFLNLQETQKEDRFMNHTSPSATTVADPKMSAYLYWTGATEQSMGPAIALAVSPGDTVTAEAYVRYHIKESYGNGLQLMLLPSLLGASFSFTGGFDGMTTTRTTQLFDQALIAGNWAGKAVGTDQPAAYLNYIVFDASMNNIGSDRVPIPEEAGFFTGEEIIPNMHARVNMNEPVIVPAGGKYIYVWVSNESPGTEVWFDDFSVTHTAAYVSESTDYGVWGDVLRTTSSEDMTPRESITKGMKGQYAFTGNAQNQASGNMHGTVMGATQTADRDGNANQAYKFDGVDDYIGLAGSANDLSFIQNTGVFTITAFIKLSDLSARSAIIGSSNTVSRKGFTFAYETFGNEYGERALRFSSSTGESGGLNLGAGNDFAISDLSWHHVAVVGDGKSFYFYLDGVRDGQSTPITAYSTGASSYDAVIGATRNSSTGVLLPMHGSVDEVFVFDKALSDSEIRLLAAGASAEDIDEVLKPVNKRYRHGYQGQFAEHDEETGWNHFEMREYDPIIGRWLVPDPQDVHWSPYLAMNNNPVNSVDPTGGCETGNCPDPEIGTVQDGQIMTAHGWVTLVDIDFTAVDKALPKDISLFTPEGFESFRSDLNMLLSQFFEENPNYGVVIWGDGTFGGGGQVLQGRDWKVGMKVEHIKLGEVSELLSFFERTTLNKGSIDNTTLTVNNLDLSAKIDNIVNAVLKVDGAAEALYNSLKEHADKLAEKEAFRRWTEVEEGQWVSEEVTGITMERAKKMNLEDSVSKTVVDGLKQQDSIIKAFKQRTKQ